MSRLKFRDCVIAAAVLGLSLVPLQGGTQSTEAEARVAIAKAFVDQRADASGTIPAGALYQAWRDVTALPRASFAFADPSWRSVGPAGLFIAQSSFGGVFAGEHKAGRVNSIAIHPADARVMLIGSQGGVWRTTDGGHTWTPVTDGACSSSIGAVIFDPVNPSIVYAGTGDGRGFVQPGCGVIRSIDGGLTWGAPPTTTMNGTLPYQIAIERTTAGSMTATTLYAATVQGLFVSNNSGSTWSLRLSGAAFSVVAHPTRPGVVFASMFRSASVPRSNVWRSSDAGVTWAPLPNPLTSTTAVVRMTLTISEAAPDRVVALTGDFNTRRFLGLFRWDDLLALWTQLPGTGIVTSTTGYPFIIGQQSEYNQALAVDPRDPARIWVAGVGAFHSQNAGQTFSSAARSVHVDWHALVFNPGDADHMVAGTDGGVYVSFDGGRTWRARNVGLAITQVYPGLSVHPSGLWLYAGLQDNNAVYFTGSTVWNNLSFLGDGGYTAVNPADPATVYVTHAFLNFITRRARGSPEEVRTTGILSSDRGSVPRPIVVDRMTPTTIYFGTQRLYRSINEGQLWTPVSNDLTRGSGFITSIAINPNNPANIWVTTSDGVIAVTTDGGVTFTRFVFSTSRFFSKVVLDPSNPLRAIATAATIGAPRATETRDGGLTFFTTIGSQLPNVPVHTGVLLPGTSTFAVGTDYGVLLTNDAGATWTQGPPGLPTTIVYDLAFAPNSGTLFASTFGRGVFAIRPGTTQSVLRGDVDGDGRLTAQDALTIQEGLVGIHPPSGYTLYPNGDTNCDGTLTGVDAMLTLKTAVGLMTPGTCVGTLARPIGTARPQLIDAGASGVVPGLARGPSMR
ncbi:MAG: hypothetical protein ACT4OZ_12670 [Gemmatimonadota bacterium]